MASRDLRDNCKKLIQTITSLYKLEANSRHE